MATQPSERTLETEMFGRTVSYEYSETWVGYSMLSLRLVMAWIFFQAGIEKWAEGGFGDPLAWSSAGFLENAIDPANPLSGFAESIPRRNPSELHASGSPKPLSAHFAIPA